MAYYVSIVQKNLNDGQLETVKALYECDTFDYALSMFHNELAYRQEERISTMCTITDEYGNQQRKEYYSKDGNAS